MVRLRREEWIPDAGDRVGIHPGAAIAHLQLPAWRAVGDRDRRGRDVDTTGARVRLRCVDDEVADELREQAAVCMDRDRTCGRLDDELDASGNAVRELIARLTQ